MCLGVCISGVTNSLQGSSGSFSTIGWLAVDQEALQHRRRRSPCQLQTCIRGRSPSCTCMYFCSHVTTATCPLALVVLWPMSFLDLLSEKYLRKAVLGTMPAKPSHSCSPYDQSDHYLHLQTHGGLAAPQRAVKVVGAAERVTRQNLSEKGVRVSIVNLFVSAETGSEMRFYSGSRS